MYKKVCKWIHAVARTSKRRVLYTQAKACACMPLHLVGKSCCVEMLTSDMPCCIRNLPACVQQHELL